MSNPDQPPEEQGLSQAPSAQAFTAIPALYDLLMDGVPYRQWVVYLHQLFAQHHARPHTILDLACGTGNVAELLAAQGFAVTGVDLSPGMIAEAQRKAVESRLTIDYAVQDAAELDLSGRAFDVCISLFDSLNYVTDPARLAKAMRRVAAHLVPQGLFIFDLNTEFALQNRFFDQDNLDTDDRLRYDWDSTYSPHTRLCSVHMRFWYREDSGEDRAFEEIHWQYAYRIEEVLAMLSAAGFGDVTTYQAYSLHPPGPLADRIFYVARKP